MYHLRRVTQPVLLRPDVSSGAIKNRLSIYKLPFSPDVGDDVENCVLRLLRAADHDVARTEYVSLNGEWQCC